MKKIIELEKELHTFECRQSKKRLDELFSDDFLEIGTSGNTYYKSDQINKLPAADNIRIESSNFKAIELASNIVSRSYMGIT